MTSDAKVGLLLGLVFIFIIAFIINGLPNMRKADNNNQLTTNMLGSGENSLGLTVNKRKVREVINPTAIVQKQVPVSQLSKQPGSEVRYSISLPSRTTETSGAINLPLKPPAKTKSTTVKSSPANKTHFYVVEDGDNLAVIAKKFYGQAQGNKTININRIFAANRKSLNSPDKLYVGQKLIIPPLSGSRPDKTKTDTVLAGNMFEKVKSIGKRQIAKINAITKSKSVYVVRQGDSLWEIAASQLGNGDRYGEIVKLNASLLHDEDALTVGMRLKIPAQ